MADLIIKRTLPDQQETPVKRHHDTKKSAKPGRKPITTEPENKRKAQNRAAQRAFRERKEKKLQELEDRVAELENEAATTNSENEFLRLQVQKLMAELKKYNGSPPQANDIQPPTSSFDFEFGKDDSFNLPRVRQQLQNLHQHKSTSSGSNASPSSTTSGSTNSVSTSSSVLFDSHEKNSASTSPFGNDSLNSTSGDFLFGNSYNIDSKPTATPAHSNNNNGIEQDFNESVSGFCLNMSEACGNKENPIPKKFDNISSKVSISDNSTFTTPNVTTTNFSPATTSSINTDPFFSSNTLFPELNSSKTQTNFKDDFTNLFNSDRFDSNFIFDTEESPNVSHVDQNNSDLFSGLTTEESLYDPYGVFESDEVMELDSYAKDLIDSMSTATDVANANNTSDTTMLSQDQESVQKKLSISNNLPFDVSNNKELPRKRELLLTCSAVWDRITMHPKYLDIDIEGLCSELKSKAKCSEKGAVIEESMVSKMLDSCPEKD